jgi:hypothetical protein
MNLTLYFFFFIFWLLILLLLFRLSLLLLIFIFNTLIQQILIDHYDLLDRLVTIPLLLACIIDDQSLLMCEKAGWVEFSAVSGAIAFFAPVKGRVRAISLTVGWSRRQYVTAICMVNGLSPSESSGKVCILWVNEFTMGEKELWALWVDLGLPTLGS